MPRSIAVFGATGGLGRQVVRQALADGLEVRALCRTPGTLDPHEGLVVIHGDFGDAGAVASTVAGTGGVVSCIGHAKGQEPAVYGLGMQHVVDAMADAGCRRLVAISGAGLELEGDQTGLGRRLIILALKVFAADLLAGKAAEWEVIRDADVDWTVVRVARMVDAAPKGQVATALDRVSGSATVAYADVAAWMLARVSDDDFVGEAPFVSGL